MTSLIGEMDRTRTYQRSWVVSTSLPCDTSHIKDMVGIAPTCLSKTFQQNWTAQALPYSIFLVYMSMVAKVGLKPTYNLLLLRNIVYRMIHFYKQFPILQLIPLDLLITLSGTYDVSPPRCFGNLRNIILCKEKWWIRLESNQLPAVDFVLHSPMLPTRIVPH